MYGTNNSYLTVLYCEENHTHALYSNVVLKLYSNFHVLDYLYCTLCRYLCYSTASGGNAGPIVPQRRKPRWESIYVSHGTGSYNTTVKLYSNFQYSILSIVTVTLRHFMKLSAGIVVVC